MKQLKEYALNEKQMIYDKILYVKAKEHNILIMIKNDNCRFFRKGI